MKHVALLFAAVQFGMVACGSDVEPRPHLLFMMADQMRWDALSHVAGPANNAFRTPNLDRIAAEGIDVHYSWSSTPTCTPARAALLTGRSPWGHGMLGLAGVAHEYPLEMPRVLADAGYNTTCIGKNHFGYNWLHGYQNKMLYDGLGSWKVGAPHNWTGEFDDYDAWFAELMPGKDPSATLDHYDHDGWNTWHGAPFMYDESLHPTAWVGRQAVDFLQSYPNETEGVAPFMLKVSFHRPHSPYDPPQRLLDAVKESDLRPVKLCQDNATDAPQGHGSSWCQEFKGCKVSADAWCGMPPEDEAVLGRRAYAASVNFVDEWVGHIYNALVDRGLLERTWILWTADHGDGQGDMYHWRKGYPYEFSAHVPMLLRWPESWATRQHGIVPRGTVVEPPVTAELRDVFHTMVDAAGIADNSSLIPAYSSGSEQSFAAEDGKSLICLLRDPLGQANCDYAPNPGPWRKWTDMEHSTCYSVTNHWSALSDGRMKYVFRAYYGDEQLFNLTADPEELVDVSGSVAYSDELMLWRDRLIEQFEREGRGDKWVLNGSLVARKVDQAKGPNYPGNHPPSPSPVPPPSPTPAVIASDAVGMHKRGVGACNSNDCWILQASSANNTSLQLSGSNLCLSVLNDMALQVQDCSSTGEAGMLQYFNTRNHTGDPTQVAAVLSHVPSGRCVSSVGAGLELCDEHAEEQQWIFGSSGRLCAKYGGGLCLRVMHPKVAEPRLFVV